ncbi:MULTISPECIES: hypothetical protein [unclassified Gilliamella]|uniref:hypothetical protein n=1 Tax=unclassified Gilliamella TaxID=2685620 RepID=UPI002269D0CA|nr:MULTISPECIES: hypothetical protein [unclassified Gilliamella]MCX8582925.1 hypothetical protein [Gilliamella sp. B3372]MCX8586487.1 hypothetical protein [Gilliamella sp. B3562]MCX8595426.1 hypothetical protein [Gilliamella sp. B3367]MCX8660381.1 hypothetical protein [Gilliamella sp. B2772]MCX8671701.1 hypothetical protein [Gilliamella sp. B2785]
MDSQNNLSFLVTFEKTVNFIRNRFPIIAIASVVLALANSVLSYIIFDPAALAASMVYYANPAQVLSSLFGKVLLLSIVFLFIAAVTIGIIYNLTTSDKFDMKLVSQRILPAFLNLAGFTAIYFIILIIGIILLSLIMWIIGMILPQQLIALLTLLIAFVIFLVLSIIANYFSASLIVPDSMGFFQRFVGSHKLAVTKWKAPLLMILISCGITIVLGLINYLLGNNIIVTTITSIVSMFVSFFVCSFFYRLYNASNNVELPKLDDNNQNNQQIIS